MQNRVDGDGDWMVGEYDANKGVSEHKNTAQQHRQVMGGG